MEDAVPMKNVDVVAAILAQNANSDPIRRQMKYKAMRESAFVFFRGTCHLFYARLPPLGALRKVPAAWACGDLHLENFGSYKGDNGLVYFDVNDFDEAVLAPCIWDLIRVVASITLARKDLSLGKKAIADLSRYFVTSYAEALANGKPRWIERDTATGIIGQLLQTLKGKSASELIAGRTETSGGKLRLKVDNAHALAASPAERKRATALIDDFTKQHPDIRIGKTVAIANRIAGTGSLGIERYVILTRGKGEKKRLRLLDLKLAVPSSSAAKTELAQPAFASEAERVVTIQRFFQAVAPALLNPVIAGDRSFLLKQLQPSADRLDLDSMAKAKNREGIIEALGLMARTLAWGQLRMASRYGAAPPADLMDFATKNKWRDAVLELAQECAKRAEDDWQTYCQAFDAKAFAEQEAAGDPVSKPAAPTKKARKTSPAP